MNITRDIQTLSEFKQNASKMVKQVQETGHPVVLTVNGKPVAVVQDPASYQELIDFREYAESVAVLRTRIIDIENSHQWLSHSEVFDQIRAKYRIKRS